MKNFIWKYGFLVIAVVIGCVALYGCGDSNTTVGVGQADSLVIGSNNATTSGTQPADLAELVESLKPAEEEEAPAE